MKIKILWGILGAFTGILVGGVAFIIFFFTWGLKWGLTGDTSPFSSWIPILYMILYAFIISGSTILFLNIGRKKQQDFNREDGYKS